MPVANSPELHNVSIAAACRRQHGFLRLAWCPIPCASRGGGSMIRPRGDLVCCLPPHSKLMSEAAPLSTQHSPFTDLTFPNVRLLLVQCQASLPGRGRVRSAPLLPPAEG